MVVDGDSKDLLRLLLADDVFLKVFEYRFGVRGRAGLHRQRPGRGGGGSCPVFFIDDFAAEVDAFVADVDRAGPR